jgi:hypothetical protein
MLSCAIAAVLPSTKVVTTAAYAAEIGERVIGMK